MSRRAWWAVAVGGMFGFVLSTTALVLLAEPGVVTTTDGTVYEGDVIESEKEVTIVIRGIKTVLPRADVAKVEYKGDEDEEFRKRLAALGANDIQGRIALARDEFNRRRYDLAREAAADALRIDPNSREATDMLDLIDRQVRLERTGGAGAAPGGAPAPPRAGPAPRGPAQGERRTLTADDINLIRQKELKETDSGVRITFQSDVKKRFAEQENMTFAEFNRLPPVEQALRIIERGDAEMRGQVRVTSDPSALSDYKRFVQPVVLGGCATGGCHGGSAGGDFMLYSPAENDAVAYTNFYILTQYARRPEGGRNDAGIFGASVRRMIERGRGETSLLANYGLPTNVAEFDHPPVGGKPVQPVFRNKQDQRYEQVVRWMNESLLRIEPNYGIDFALPSATTRPAPAPAPEGAGEGTGETPPPPPGR